MSVVEVVVSVRVDVRHGLVPVSVGVPGGNARELDGASTCGPNRLVHRPLNRAVRVGVQTGWT